MGFSFFLFFLGKEKYSYTVDLQRKIENFILKDKNNLPENMKKDKLTLKQFWELLATEKNSGPWKEHVGRRIIETFKAFIKGLESKET